MVAKTSLTNLAHVLIIATVVLVMMISLSTSLVSAAPADGADCPKTAQFFGLEPWYQYLPYTYSSTTGHCEIQFSDSALLGKGSAILLIVLAIIDDLLRVAGIVAIAFVIVGGFKFITSQGEPEAAVSARKTILFAVIGLAIALIAVVIVSFIGSAIGK